MQQLPKSYLFPQQTVPEAQAEPSQITYNPVLLPTNYEKSK